ncbi:MAG: histone deacetylase [Candidatus Sumerlaeota bacterium]|nr:histone deacetylase [Candidatus Sumerlaeota bacterium]
MSPIALFADNTNPSRKTALVYGDIYLQHRTGERHPERPERLTAIMQRLERDGLLPQLLLIPPVAAAHERLLAVHSSSYIAEIQRASAQAPGYAGSPDTSVSSQSYAVALEAVGGVLAAIDAVMEGKAQNAFCAIRPPGHHATKDKAMGFCLFNNVAIAARYIQERYKLKKVLIVDWDVHHGNGTQAIFNDDPTVFYFSVHQHPFYPGTGGAEDKGSGQGLGTKLNVPMPAGSGDSEYIKAFSDVLTSAALKFHPDFVLISAGFDASEGDLLGQMKLTPEGYAELTRIVAEIADQNCNGRLVSMLEGGYNLEKLAAAAQAHIRVLMKFSARESRK